LIHGEQDGNAGTFPIQSERLFQAIRGNGGTARLVMLPHEGHAYLGRESVMHVVAEELDWLERWLGPAHGAPAHGAPAQDAREQAAPVPAVAERGATERATAEQGATERGAAEQGGPPT
jgi:Prolyl oligopeptidase family